MDRKRGTEPTFHQTTVDNPNEAPVWPTNEGDLGQGTLGEQRQPDHDVLTQEPELQQFDKNVAEAHEIARDLEEDRIPFAEPETQPAPRRGLSKKGKVAIVASGLVGAIGTGVAAGALFLSRASNDVSAGPTPGTEPVATSSPNPGASESEVESSQEVTEENVQFRVGESTFTGIYTDPYESVGAKYVIGVTRNPTPEAHDYEAGAKISNLFLGSAKALTELEVVNVTGEQARDFANQATNFILGEGPLADKVEEWRDKGLIIESYETSIFGLESDGFIHSQNTITVKNPQTGKETVYNARVVLQEERGAWHQIPKNTEVWPAEQQN